MEFGISLKRDYTDYYMIKCKIKGSEEMDCLLDAHAVIHLL